jgi:peptide/nickel transport system ATP-binding protein
MSIASPAADRADTATAAIEVHGLSKVFASHGFGPRRTTGIAAVKDVTLRLESGTTLAVVGESGSGKTTLARMVVGLETPSAGEIICFGERVSAHASTRDRRAFGRKVQMVFQNPYRSLDPSQLVGKGLDEVLRLHFSWDAPARAARIADLLALVALDSSVLEALPRQLSGGQRQRVCIARALAADPQVLVLDEALSSLDVSVQAHILNLLCDIRDKTGVSYLFITHDLAVVRQVADEVVVMRQGEIVERGNAEAVLDHPQHPYTRLLLDSVPREGWRPRTTGGQSDPQARAPARPS